MPLFLFMLFLLVLWRLKKKKKGVFYSGWIEYFGGQGMYWILFNRLTPNDLYMSRTAPLTSKRCILYRECAKIKKNNSGAKELISVRSISGFNIII
jgi:hypothetical protein